MTLEKNKKRKQQVAELQRGSPGKNNLNWDFQTMKKVKMKVQVQDTERQEWILRRHNRSRIHFPLPMERT